MIPDLIGLDAENAEKTAKNYGFSTKIKHYLCRKSPENGSFLVIRATKIDDSTLQLLCTPFKLNA